MSLDLFSYAGKTALVVGGATGMGAATARLAADLGAEVIVMDVAEVNYPVKQAIKLDLRDREAIDAALAQLPKTIDLVFSCAGVADGTPGILLINFLGQRYLLDQLLDNDRLSQGGAVVMISSVAGLAWQANMPQVLEFLDIKDWDSAAGWVADHEGTDSYLFSKQAVNGYVTRSAIDYLRKGVRINAVLPGPTDTPLARANPDVWLGFGADYRSELGIEALSPEQIAGSLILLASRAASGINGVTLLVDWGHVGACLTGAWHEPAMAQVMQAGS